MGGAALCRQSNPGVVDPANENVSPPSYAQTDEDKAAWSEQITVLQEKKGNASDFASQKAILRRLVHEPGSMSLPCALRKEFWLLMPSTNEGMTLTTLISTEGAADSEQAKSIERDVNRTFSGVPTLLPAAHSKTLAEEGDGETKALGRVLLALAVEDPECGYVQGMNFMAGWVLRQGLAEQEAFGICRYLLQKKAGLNLRLFYLAGLPKLQQLITLLDDAVAVALPQLHEHLQSHNITATLYATPWLMTLFVTTQLQLTTLLAIWDLLLLSDDADAAEQLLLQVSLSLLRIVEQEVAVRNKTRRKRGGCDFEETMQLLSKDCNGRFSQEATSTFLSRIEGGGNPTKVHYSGSGISPSGSDSSADSGSAGGGSESQRSTIEPQEETEGKGAAV
jgi:hypothetical protein